MSERDRKVAEKCACNSCDSTFKLMYNVEDTSHYHTYCPFCGEELIIDDGELDQYDDMDA